MGDPEENDRSIMRSDLDGANMMTIVPPGGTFTPKQLQLEKRSGKLYWSDREGMRVTRANVDERVSIAEVAGALEVNPRIVANKKFRDRYSPSRKWLLSRDTAAALFRVSLRDPLGAGLAFAVIVQPVIAMPLVPLSPAPHRALRHSQHSRPLPATSGYRPSLSKSPVASFIIRSTS
jgi:hypothetical protein